ncbi:fructose-bisphosphate aldolase 6, cytosolic-like [Oryza glaberrima]|uniref:fructose-bisphosphate aldolase 6, cytosolic-like n=1 Tax=Oryza glaberrima TaxID=4538 RepID=UPI00023E1DA3|nr:fructose-bisphosphate aldolase 6, cytosolic-like [Oryza glaberrima]
MEKRATGWPVGRMMEGSRATRRKARTGAERRRRTASTSDATTPRLRVRSTEGSDSQRRRHARESAEVAAAALLPSLVLVADESTGTIGKRLASINVENVEENRRALRKLLFTVPCVLDCLSGVILFEETLYQSTRDGTPFVDVLAAAGVLAGIKVDKGTAELAGTDRETTTQGHAGLGERCRRYYAAGVRFAKWRAVLSIGASKPSQLAVDANAQA